MSKPPALPSTDAEFPLCTAIERHCNRWWYVSSSPVTCRRWLLSSLINDAVSGPSTPVVSMTTGTKRWLRDKLEYLVFLRCSAAATTAPAFLVASARYDWAEVSGQVASHTKSLSLFYGTIVMTSGRFPSERQIPDGSSRDGICGKVRARCQITNEYLISEGLTAIVTSLAWLRSYIVA